MRGERSHGVKTMKIKIERDEWMTIGWDEIKIGLDQSSLKMGKFQKSTNVVTIPEELQGKRCCLGFVAEYAGREAGLDDAYIDKHLTNALYPYNYAPGKFPLMRFSMLECLNMEKQEYVDFCLSVANVNDDPTLSLDDKEKKLKKLFAKAGHELEFV